MRKEGKYPDIDVFRILFLLRRGSSGVPARVCTGAEVGQRARACADKDRGVDQEHSRECVPTAAAGGREGATSPCAALHRFGKGTVLAGEPGRTASNRR